MNAVIKKYNILPGDEVVVPKSSWNLIRHHAVYLGYDNKGIDWMIENNVDEGVRLITADAFFKQVIQINAINRFKGTNAERKALVQKALASVGQPYRLIDFNCQHFTSELLTGKRVSYQVQNVAAIAVVAVIMGLLISE
jgi:uncharacterized protein YycO